MNAVRKHRQDVIVTTKYSRAINYLKGRYRAILFEENGETGEEYALFDFLALKLSKQLGIKAKDGSSLLTQAKKKRNVSSLFPLPAELIIQLIIEEKLPSVPLTNAEKKNIRDGILSESVLLEELFIAEGLSSDFIQKKFKYSAAVLTQPPKIKGIGIAPKLAWWKRVPVFGLVAILALQSLQAAKIHTLSLLATNMGKTMLAGTVIAALGITTLIVSKVSPDIGKTANTPQPKETSPAITQIDNTPVILQWKFRPQMSVNMVRTADVNMYVGSGRASAREKNIVNFVATKVNEDRTSFEGIFKTFIRSKAQVPQLARTFHSKFDISNDGQYSVPSQYVQPNERSIPSFPKTPVKPGDTWSLPVTFYYHDLQPPFVLETNATYTYLSNFIQEGQPLAAINYEIKINENIVKQLGLISRTQVAFLTAHIRGRVHWKIAHGIPKLIVTGMEESHTLVNRQVKKYTIAMRSDYDVTFPIQAKTMERLEASVQKKLAKFEGVRTYTEKDGLHIELNEVLFTYDSSNLTINAKSILNQITPILNEYPSHEIMIEGHTDNRGSVNYNEKLSLQRAQSVSKHIVKQLTYGDRKIYLKAFGESKPIASNQTEQGRKKNRRVEIILKQSGH